MRYLMVKFCAILVSLLYYPMCALDEGFCSAGLEGCEGTQRNNNRYILYDVNPPEGFNLRRDVYMRFAIFAHKLSKSSNPKLNNFKLVLPPWTHLYHWRQNTKQQIPWSHFFDLDSLQKFAPVKEMHKFFDELGVKYSKVKIDEVFVLQHFENMFESGNFEERMEISNCNKKMRTNFFHYDNITFENLKCLSFHGHVSQLEQILENTTSRTILFDHAEVALHDRFGDEVYWQARRSMRFNVELKQIADQFRQAYLNSTDFSDGTELPEDWRDEKLRRTAKGGPYLGVHFRRGDFAYSRSKDVPSIRSGAQQIKQHLKTLGLNKVFVATDAIEEEFLNLKSFLQPDFEVYRYAPDNETMKKLQAGGIAIIDQIICSHARFFIGTHESTFSFRIQEEREIMGFPIKTTFNRLCGDNPNQACETPSVWKIVYL